MTRIDRRSLLRGGLALGCSAAASPLLTPMAFASAPWENRLVVIVLRGDVAHGLIALRDEPRADAAEAVAQLNALGISPVMLTGDNRRTASAIAVGLGIEHRAELMPEDKVAAIQNLTAEAKVMMIGDGINDAPALARADLGIAMGTGTGVAMAASEVTIVAGDLRAVIDAIGLARRTLATIKGNLFWAFVYNISAVPLAAMGLLDPMIAAGAMAFSSIFVVGNSLRLRHFRGRLATGPLA